MRHFRERFGFMVKHYDIGFSVPDSILDSELVCTEGKKAVIEFSDAVWQTNEGNSQVDIMVQILIANGYNVYVIDKGAPIDRDLFEEFIANFQNPGISELTVDSDEQFVGAVADASLVVANQLNYIVLARLLAKRCIAVVGDVTSFIKKAGLFAVWYGGNAFAGSVVKFAEPPGEKALLEKGVMDKIKELLGAGAVDTAKVILGEYEKTAGIDADSLSARGIVCMMENDTAKASDYFRASLGKSYNADTLYNLAYISEMNGSDDEALAFYEQAFTVCDDSLEDELLQKIAELT